VSGDPGPYERHLEAAVGRNAPWLRAVVVGLCGMFGLASYDGTATVTLAAVTAGVATLVPCLPGRLHTAAPNAYLLANLLVAGLVGLSQLYLGPQPFSGWIVATASIMTVTCFYEWPRQPLAAYGLVAVTVAAYVAGCLLAGAELPLLPAGRMVMQALVSWVGLLMVRRVARLCDELAERAAQQRSVAVAARARRAADRAYLALLHDTASTTFLMVSTRGADDFDWLPGQARRDLELLTAHSSVVDREINLAELLNSLTSYPGLDLRLEVRGPLPMPVEQALAIYHGVREALSNVRRHAGDPNPTLTAEQSDDQVIVSVRDHGRGFTPDQVSPHRRGLSHSIRDRMAQAGGQATVVSAPGEGTTVCWTWSRG
jgi:signal transduction histidine kinase